MKPKALIFYTYLPPWRIDVFNEMGKFYDLHIIFLDAEIENFKYDRELLVSKLNVAHTFYNFGFKVGDRPVRLGLLKLLRKHNPSVVFSHEYSPTSFLLSVFNRFRLFSYKLIITTSDNVDIAKSVTGVKAIIRDKILSHSQGLVVYSSEVKNWYKTHFNRLKIEVCPNIQNPASLRKDIPAMQVKKNELQKKYNIANKKCLLYVGRLSKVKGLNLLIDAFNKSQNNDFILAIVGKGPEEKVLVDKVQKLGLENKIKFIGFSAGVDLYSWYLLADIFVLPSTYEPFGAVVNEALIYGCPVLASKYIGALDFIKQGFNGTIFDPLKHDEFVQVLNDAYTTYANFNLDRKSLMLHEFDKYVLNFKTIAE